MRATVGIARDARQQTNKQTNKGGRQRRTVEILCKPQRSTKSAVGVMCVDETPLVEPLRLLI
jgi:hypothetical protein